MSTLCSAFSFTSNLACRTFLTSQSFHTVLKLLPSSAQAQTSSRLSWYYCQSQTDPDPTRKVCFSYYTLKAKLLNKLRRLQEGFIHNMNPNHYQAHPYHPKRSKSKVSDQQKTIDGQKFVYVI